MLKSSCKLKLFQFLFEVRTRYPYLFSLLFGHPARIFTCHVKILIFAWKTHFFNNCERLISFESVSAFEWGFYIFRSVPITSRTNSVFSV